jgi:hypothetical protein
MDNYLRIEVGGLKIEGADSLTSFITIVTLIKQNNFLSSGAWDKAAWSEGLLKALATGRRYLEPLERKWDECCENCSRVCYKVHGI